MTQRPVQPMIARIILHPSQLADLAQAYSARLTLWSHVLQIVFFIVLAGFVNELVNASFLERNLIRRQPSSH